MDQPSVALVRRFIALVESGGADVENLLDPQATIVTHPNLFAPAGHTRSLAEATTARDAGRRMAPEQRYDVHSVDEFGDGRVAVRLTWSATLAEDTEAFASGTRLQSEIAQFYEIREGKIVRLEAFDCYHPPRPS